MVYKCKVLLLIIIALCSLSQPGYGQDDSKIPELIYYGGGDNYPPYEFLDKNGKPAGFNVDLMRSIGDVMGLKVDFKLGQWSTINSQLGNPEGIHITDMFRTPSRENQYEFANSHAMVSHQVVTRQGSIDIEKLEHLQGTSVLAERGTALIELLKQNKLNIKVKEVESEVEGLRKLASGDCDAALVSQHHTHLLIQKYRLNNLVVSGPLVYPLKLSFVAKKGDQALINKVNIGLEILKRTGEYSEIYVKWFGSNPDNSALIVYAKWIGLAIVILVLAAIFWILMLRRLVKMRTTQLKTELRIKVDTAKELKEINDDLRRKTDELDKFVYSISHDLRSPITSILGLIDLMRIELKDELAQEYAYQIGGSIDKLIHYIDHLLSYWANERDKINLEPINFQDVIKEALATNKKVEGADKVQVHIDMNVRTPFKSDKTRMLLILSNLIRNGIEFRSASSEPFINLIIKDSHDNLDIEVQDNGEGIDENKLDSIFEMFYRGSNKSQGCGLGLYITREAIRKLGGEVTVNSSPGEGTSFFISLPQKIQ